jgi:hypothetical protein
MGLLDFANTPEGMQGLSLLAAAAPTMEPTNLAGRIAMAGNTYRGLLDNQLRSQFIKSQIDENASQAKMRELQAAQLARKNDLINGWLSGQGGDVAQANQAVIGQTGNLAPTNANAALQSQAMGAGGGLLGGISSDAIRADLAFNDGKNIAQWMFERTKPNIEFINGVAVDKNRTNAGTSIPQMSPNGQGYQLIQDPTAPGGYRVGVPQGALDAYRQFKGADAEIAANSELVKVVGPDGAERYVPKSQVLGAPRPPQPTAAPRSMAPNAGDADRFAILTQELDKAQKAGNARDVQAIQAEISRLPASAKTDASPSGLAVSGGFQATPTTAQSLSKEAGKGINESFIKSRYEPALAAGDAANDMLTNVKVARDSMRAMGGTGWGAEAKATAANVLAGLGMAPANAKMYAANAQTFQNAAMSNLKTTLDAAKGPQTEGDAARASQLFAQLRNTPQANEFILDMAQAKAEREQMKARFFQSALPIAQQKGDLAEVEREWTKRAPSVFSMPSMQRWGKQQ